MDIALTVLLLLLLVGLSGTIVRFLPRLPLPLVQVGIGAFAASPVIGLRVSFDPELFMLLFVPPLLFADGWRIPKREFFRLRGPIIRLALGLVIFTVVGAGYFVHWAIPDIPLSVAFALAAVLSPTDAVAVSAISGRIKIPPRLMHILEGEALLNDASGLVAMRFAVAATLAGTFSLLNAARSFLIVATGGLAIGFAVAGLLSWIHGRFTGRRGQEPAPHIVLLLLLIPFAVYMLAERLSVSGILAAVAAGMMMNFTDLQRSGRVAVRMQARNISVMVEFVFNGLIFLLLGLQLPVFFGRPLRLTLRTSGPGDAWQLLRHTAAIWLVLLALRFIWILCGVRLVGWAKQRAGETLGLPPLRFTAAATLAGIRGAVTLAGALSLPLTVPDGSPFPARNSVIFLASGVILLSLFGGCLGLPLLLRGLGPSGEEAAHEREADAARALSAEAAIRAIQELQRQRVTPGGPRQPAEDADAAAYADVTARLITHYRQRTRTGGATGNRLGMASRARSLEDEVHLAALRAERTELYRLRSKGRINDETMRVLVDEIDLIEAALLTRQPGE